MSSVRDFWKRKGPKTRTDKVIVYGAAFLVFVVWPAFTLGLTLAYPSHEVDVTFVNEGNVVAHIYIDGTFEMSLEPGEQQEENVWGWADNKLIEAVNEDGRLLFNRNLSRDELDELQKTVIIRNDSLER
jgi:hypothetical protein